MLILGSCKKREDCNKVFQYGRTDLGLFSCISLSREQQACNAWKKEGQGKLDFSWFLHICSKFEPWIILKREAMSEERFSQQQPSWNASLSQDSPRIFYANAMKAKAVHMYERHLGFYKEALHRGSSCGCFGFSQSPLPPHQPSPTYLLPTRLHTTYLPTYPLPTHPPTHYLPSCLASAPQGVLYVVCNCTH